MQLDEELWAERQYKVLVSFVHHLAYYRTLSDAYADPQQQSEFWKWTIDAHILRAIIDWCMVFGTDSRELHWKRVVVDQYTQSIFRAHLLNRLDLTHDQWKDFRSEVMEFRNNYAAHRNLPRPVMPIMERAFQVVTVYDEWFRQSVSAIFEEPSLQQRYDRLMRTSEKPLRHAISLGPTVDQEYEGHAPMSE